MPFGHPVQTSARPASSPSRTGISSHKPSTRHGGEVRLQSGPSLTEYILRQAQDTAYTVQYSYTGSFGLMYYNARWYDPSLGRFAQADSIVPPGVQGLDRYAYVNNSPMNYVDPSGHFTCSNDRNSDDYCPGKPSSSIGITGGGKRGNSRGGREMGDDFHGRRYSYESYTYTNDTMELAGYLPFTSSQWGSASLFLDETALVLDTIAGMVVLGHVGLGAAGTLTFEGNPTGAAGGYIVGELNPITRGLVTIGNFIATGATQFGLVQALKDVSHKNVTTLTISPKHISITSETRISGNAVLAVGLTTIGWAAQPVSLSLPAQYMAVQNDKGNIPLPSVTFTNSITIPLQR